MHEKENRYSAATFNNIGQSHNKISNEEDAKASRIA